MTDEVAGGQVKNLFAMDGRIKPPIEVLQRFQATEIGGFGATCHLALLPDIQFVLADQFQELGMAEPVGDRFLQSHVQGLDQLSVTENRSKLTFLLFRSA